MRVPLIGGADQRRSVIANNQRRVNYYAEVNRKDAAAPVTLYQRPGLRPFGTPAVRFPCRGIWRSSQGRGYALFGPTFYKFTDSAAFTALGTIGTSFGRAAFTDNGSTGLLVDGSSNGYTVDLESGAFATLVDPTGSFTGSTQVDYLDTFTLFNYPGTRNFGCSLSNELVFDPTYIAGKTAYPEPLETFIVSRRQLLLIGALKTEIWYNSGGALFPFAIVQGAYVEHGTVAKYSVAAQDISVYMLSQNKQGQGIVLEIAGYQTRRISNHALENAIRKMPTIADAIGMCYQLNGHVFYMLTFPSADQTWVYDAAVQDPELAWYQDATLGEDGELHRSRINCLCNVYGQLIAGDWQSGQLYVLDLDTYTDNGAPIPYIAGFPLITSGIGPDGFTVVDGDGKEAIYSRFQLDMEVGHGPKRSDGSPAGVELWYSNDRGMTYRAPMIQSAGKPAEWNARPTWRSLEKAQARLFEIRHSIPAPAAIQGAWLDNQITGQ